MIRREAVRAVMLTPQGRMLLMQAQVPRRNVVIWYAPGGGSKTERMIFRRFKWWTPSEISASPDLFAPEMLATRLRHLIERGPPAAPVDVGA